MWYPFLFFFLPATQVIFPVQNLFAAGMGDLLLGMSPIFFLKINIYFSGQLKKERENGSWQLVYVALHLDTLYVYKDKQV